tara:strand:+ start:64 stop:897 length:834 start_codon:yes stop_codon:yes gene_type:complete
MKIAGAQIPVGTNLQANKIEIFKAIDWAKENEVDHLLTPECALSGWIGSWVENFSEIESILKEVEDHQKEAGIGLHLGTNFIEPELYGSINRNQIRHYNATGYLQGKSYKTYTVADMERVLYRDSRHDALNIIDLCTPNGTEPFYAGALICNDFWGSGSQHTRSLDKDIPTLYKETDLNISILLHATNGRNKNKLVDDFEWDIFDMWHNAHLRMASYSTRIPIITVDACTEWDWDGNEDDIDTTLTSSESGVLINGSWKTNVSRTGRQYFKYDFSFT